MLYQINIFEIKDIRRVAYKPQNFYLQAKSKKGIVKNSPTLSSMDPVFNPPWKLFFPENDHIQFTIKSLEGNNFNNVLCCGWADLKRFRKSSKKEQNSIIYHTVTMESSYNNFAQLRMTLIKTFQSQSSRTKMQDSQQTKYRQSQMKKEIRQFNLFQTEQRPKPSFFKGVCETTNLFSFLDPSAKGQRFAFFQQSLKK